MEEENQPQQERPGSPPKPAELLQRPSMAKAASAAQPNLSSTMQDPAHLADPSLIQGHTTSTPELSIIIPPQEIGASASSAGPSTSSNMPVIKIELESSKYQQENCAIQPQQEWLLESPAQVITLRPSQEREAQASSAGPSTLPDLPVIKITLESCQQEEPGIPRQQDWLLESSAQVNTITPLQEKEASASSASLSTLSNIPVIKISLESSKRQQDDPATLPQPPVQHLTIRISVSQRNLCDSTEGQSSNLVHSTNVLRREEPNLPCENSSTDQVVSTPRSGILIQTEGEGVESAPSENQSAERSLSPFQLSTSSTQTERRPNLRKDSNVWQKIQEFQRASLEFSETASKILKGASKPSEQEGFGTTSSENRSAWNNRGTLLRTTRSFFRKDSFVQQTVEKFQQRLSSSKETITKNLKVLTDSSAASTESDVSIPTQDPTSSHSESVDPSSEATLVARSDDFTSTLSVHGSDVEHESEFDLESEIPGSCSGSEQAMKSSTEKNATDYLGKLSCSLASSAVDYEAAQSVHPEMCEPGTSQPGEESSSVSKGEKKISLHRQFELKKLVAFANPKEIDAKCKAAAERVRQEEARKKKRVIVSRPCFEGVPEEEEVSSSSGEKLPTKRLPFLLTEAQLNRGNEFIPKLYKTVYTESPTDSSSATDQDITSPPSVLNYSDDFVSDITDTEPSETEPEIPENQRSEQVTTSAGLPPAGGTGSGTETKTSDEITSVVSLDGETLQPARESMLIRSQSHPGDIQVPSEGFLLKRLESCPSKLHYVPLSEPQSLPLVRSVSEGNVDEQSQSQRLAVVRQDAEQNPSSSGSEENVDELGQSQRLSFVSQDAEQNPPSSGSEENVDEPGQSQGLPFVSQDAEQNPPSSVPEENLDEPDRPQGLPFVGQDSQQNQDTT